MKSKLFIALCMGMVIVGCQKDNSQMAPTIQKNYTGVSSNTQTDGTTDRGTYVSTGSLNAETWRSAARSTATSGSQFIPIIEANAMIGSYLYSIRSDRNDSDVRSFSVDADMLRAYLADGNVKNVKLIFAHTEDYMKAGNIGRYAGYQTGAMTIIIAGYSSTGKYIFHDGKVLDHMTPCPYTCASGEAGSDFLY